jgi:hypothetical protein
MGIFDDDRFEAMTEVAELEAIAMSPTTVTVDFNDMLERFSEADVWRLLAALKDVME